MQGKSSWKKIPAGDKCPKNPTDVKNIPINQIGWEEIAINSANKKCHPNHHHFYNGPSLVLDT